MHRVRLTLGHIAPRITNNQTPNTITRRTMAAAAAQTSATSVSKPTSVASGHLPEHLPFGTLHDTTLDDPVQQRVRTNARELLGFNGGRPLVADGSQKLGVVGEPSQAQLNSGKPTPKLFEPLHVRGKRFMKNRIVTSPMCMYSCDDGFLNDFHLVHLGQFALGGAGMVVVEGTSVSWDGRISPVDSGLWKDEQIGPLQRIIAFLRTQNCTPGIQLAHAGRKASTIPPFQIPRLPATVAEAVPIELGGWPEHVKGPSALPWAADYHMPKEMTSEDIKLVTQQFVDAAKRAQKAGFDYVEIHAAHGYLFTSFLSPTSNKRTDQYGGSFANRIRFLQETVTAVRKVIPDLVLGVRLTCEEWTPDGWHMDDTLKLVKELKPLGVDLIDCSSGGNNKDQKIAAGPGYQVPFAAGVKKQHPDLLVAAVGMITSPTQAEHILSEGSSDVVMLAREFLREPHWSLRAARELGYDVEWAPQYNRAKPSTKK